MMTGLIVLIVGVILVFIFTPLATKNVADLNDEVDEYEAGDAVLVIGTIHSNTYQPGIGRLEPPPINGYKFDGFNQTITSRTYYGWENADVWAWLVKNDSGGWRLTTGGDIDDLKYPGYIVSSIGNVAVVAGIYLKPKIE